MKHATAISAKNAKALVAVMAVAVSGGVAMFLRDPDLPFLPIMAEHPVVMPDGALLYVQKYEVSVTEWNACYDAGDCAFRLRTTTQNEMPATGLSFVDAAAFFVAGEHIAVIPYLVRDPARGGCAVGTPPAHLGMRLVSDMQVASN